MSSEALKERVQWAQTIVQYIHVAISNMKNEIFFIFLFVLCTKEVCTEGISFNKYFFVFALLFLYVVHCLR